MQKSLPLLAETRRQNHANTHPNYKNIREFKKNKLNFKIARTYFKIKNKFS